MKDQKLRIAIQKGGRLHDKSIDLLRSCGIKVENYHSKLLSASSNFPLEVLFLRDDDIPGCVADGVADIGIVGQNVLAESSKQVIEHLELGFGKCRLSIAVPRSMAFEKISDLNGLKIATSYPTILQNFLDKNQIDAELHEIAGSVEIAPSIGLADAIFDIVSTGSTLATNGLKEVHSVMQSEAVLIRGNTISAEATTLLDKICFRIKSVQQASNNKYILLNAPNEHLDAICDILPGMNSPTIMPLAKPGWSSVHSVVNEDQFWDIIDALRDKGAEGILIVPIEKMFV
ncbi:MAG TPA: ATP phosphoribosyltransferase [Luteibaculaceae bacterium]|nr:ATP phosphoribosyltransferase [Luteibaculaceae bacterium]